MLLKESNKVKKFFRSDLCTLIGAVHPLYYAGATIVLALSLQIVNYSLETPRSLLAFVIKLVWSAGIILSLFSGFMYDEFIYVYKDKIHIPLLHADKHDIMCIRIFGVGNGTCCTKQSFDSISALSQHTFDMISQNQMLVTSEDVMSFVHELDHYMNKLDWNSELSSIVDDFQLKKVKVTNLSHKCRLTFRWKDSGERTSKWHISNR